jgi:hypothetical protein
MKIQNLICQSLALISLFQQACQPTTLQSIAGDQGIISGTFIDRDLLNPQLDQNQFNQPTQDLGIDQDAMIRLDHGFHNNDLLQNLQLPEPRLKKLSQLRFCHSIASLLGPDILCPKIEAEETYLYGFSTISASELTISPTLFEAYDQASIDIINDFLSKRNLSEILGCTPSDVNDPCLETFAKKFGKLAWRRSLSADEISEQLTLLRNITSYVGLENAWTDWMRSFILSPFFLYQVEEIEENQLQPHLKKFTQVTLASKLSFLLLDSPPDEILIDLAEQQRLTEAELLVQAHRLLQDPRAKDAILKYFEEALQLQKLEKIERDPNQFPLYSPELILSMKKEVLLNLQSIIFDENDDIRALISSKKTWIDEQLSTLYSIPLPNADDLNFQRVELQADFPRGGFLSSAAFLAGQSHRTITSPTHRGKFIQQQLRCIDIPSPPPGVNTSLESDENIGPQTTRDKLSKHREDGACFACHRLMDPIGLSLENYDALGMWRTVENGLPIDASGEVNQQTFFGAIGLAQELSQDQSVGKCLSRQFYRYANMRLESEGEFAFLDYFETLFADQLQMRWLALIDAFILNPSFLYSGPFETSVEQ